MQHMERDECGVVYEFTCEVRQVETVIAYAVIPDGGSLELRDGSKFGHPLFREMKAAQGSDRQRRYSDVAWRSIALIVKTMVDSHHTSSKNNSGCRRTVEERDRRPRCGEGCRSEL